MTTIGEISKSEDFVIHWSVENFSSLSFEDNVRYKSPWFYFAGEHWYLQSLQNGKMGFINLYVYRASPGHFIRVAMTFGVKTADGKIYHQMHTTGVYDCEVLKSGVRLINKNEILAKKSELLPSDTLTWFCRIKCGEFQRAHSSNLHKCEDLPIKRQRCTLELPVENLRWNTREAEENCALSQDFKKVLLDGKNFDLTLKVRDKELRAHQDILRARSQVFKSMLSHDTIEKESGVIDIPDCDPQAMELFLLYVYTGKVEKLDQTNIMGLYYIADKYDMIGLKEKCCDFIMKSLSHTNVCEVIQLALNHSDTSLLKNATEYFMENTVDIMLTVEWQSFLKDNLTVGNELLLKSFQKVKESKK